MPRMLRYLFLLVLPMCATLAIAAAPKPELIPTNPNAYTQAKFDQTRLAFYRRTTVEAYQKLGVHNDKWNADAILFLQSYGDRAIGLSEAKSDSQLTEMGKALVEAGCNDPLVLSCYGILLSLSNNQC